MFLLKKMQLKKIKFKQKYNYSRFNLIKFKLKTRFYHFKYKTNLTINNFAFVILINARIYFLRQDMSFLFLTKAYQCGKLKLRNYLKKSF